MEKMLSTTDIGPGKPFRIPLKVVKAIEDEVEDFKTEEIIESENPHYAMELRGPDGHTNAMIVACYGKAPDIVTYFSALTWGKVCERYMFNPGTTIKFSWYCDDDTSCLQFDFTLGDVRPRVRSYAAEQDRVDRLSPTFFFQSYRCYSFSRVNKAHLEEGDKVILPPSAFNDIRVHAEFPLLYELMYLDMTYRKTDRITHCGVLDFVAADGEIYLPDWMMEKLRLQEGDTVRAKNTDLSKGTFVKIKPHTMDFLDIPNPRAVLLKSLRNFTCLNIGDPITVQYNDKTFFLDVVETNPSPAIRYKETDCEVDFAPSLDYV